MGAPEWHAGHPDKSLRWERACLQSELTVVTGCGHEGWRLMIAAPMDSCDNTLLAHHLREFNKNRKSTQWQLQKNQ
jgi:hypothetical protein